MNPNAIFFRNLLAWVTGIQNAAVIDQLAINYPTAGRLNEIIDSLLRGPAGEVVLSHTGCVANDGYVAAWEEIKQLLLTAPIGEGVSGEAKAAVLDDRKALLEQADGVLGQHKDGVPDLDENEIVGLQEILSRLLGGKVEFLGAV